MFDAVIILMIIFSGDSYQVPQDGAGDGPWEVDGSKIHLGWSRQEAAWLCSKGEIWHRFGFRLTNHLLLSLFYRSSATTHSTGNFKWTTIDKYERDLFTFDMGIEESMILTMMIRFTSCRERIRNPMNRLSIWQRQQRYLMMMMLMAMMIREHLLSVGYCIALTLNSGKLVLFTPASEQSFWCDLYLNWCWK